MTNSPTESLVARLLTDAAYAETRTGVTIRQIGRDCAEAAERLSTLEAALAETFDVLGLAGVFIGNPEMGEGPRETAFNAVVNACAKIAVLRALSNEPGK